MLAARLIGRFHEIQNPGRGDCGVYSVIQALTLANIPTGVEGMMLPDKVGTLRLRCFNMLTIIRKQPEDGGWYQDRLKLILDTIVDGQDGRASTLRGGEYTNEALFFAVANLFQINIVLVRRGMTALPDLSLMLFSPLVPSSPTRHTICISHCTQTQHYTCLEIEEE